MKNRKWKRKMDFVKKELPATVPIPRCDRLSAIVPIDRICVEGEEMVGEEETGDLFDSVKRNGVLQPLLVRRICEEESSFGGVYLLVAGRRRLAAARKAGHRAVPCYIVTMSAKEAAVTAFVTDIDRSGKDMFALSDAICEMRGEFSMSVSEIAYRIGRSETYTAGKLLLQRYTSEEREYILENGVSEEVALLLLQIKENGRRAAALRQVCEKNMDLGVASDYVRSVVTGTLPSPRNSLSDLRFFYNSVDRLMTALRRSGADATLERKEYSKETVVTIRVQHAPDV